MPDVPGRYCWSCERRRPNEQFSRRSGRHGVCRGCYRAGPLELAHRQAVRNIDRALGYGEFIPRRHRSMVERYLTHVDGRTRVYAALVIARDAEARRESARREREEELAFEERVARDRDAAVAVSKLARLGADRLSDDDLPF